MFIRVIQKQNKNSDKKYSVYKLMEAYRNTSGQPRNRVLLSLGNLDLSKDERQQLSKRIEEIMNWDKKELFNIKCSKKIENLAIKYSNILLKKTFVNKTKEKKVEEKTAPKNIKKVNINSCKTKDVRSIGTEYIGLEIFKEIKLNEILKELDFTEEQINLTKISIISRLSSPGSERATRDWANNFSAIGELLGENYLNLSNNALYRINDKLQQNKEEIEKQLRKNEQELYGLNEKLLLYDLTNTYFEGRSLESNKTARSKKSKEKRTDCPLITLALLIDEKGFAKHSEILKGNVSEPSTLESFLNKIEENSKPDLFTEQPTIIMDAGIATEDNLTLIKEKGYFYLAVSRKKYSIEELGATELIKDCVEIKKGVKAKIIKTDSEETIIYCESEDKKLKEESIKQLFENKFLDELKKLKSSLTKKGCMKKYEKILEKIGRLKEKYSKIAQYYKINICEEKGITIDITWEIIKENKLKERFSGSYFLRTNLINLEEKELWNIYITLSKVEDSFRSLKSELEMRPVYHRKDERIEGHLFICVLSYHLLNIIQNKLKDSDIQYSWKTIRKHLNQQVRVTTSFTTEQNTKIHIRNCSEPTEFLSKIYSALKINPTALPNIVINENSDDF
jgi:transposase